MQTVATVVSEVLGVKIDDKQAKLLDSLIKIVSVPREKVEYVLGNGDASKVKLSPQAKILISVLTKKPVTLESWGDLAAKSGMKTKQDPGRIAAYYRKQLVDNKLANEVSAS